MSAVEVKSRSVFRSESSRTVSRKPRRVDGVQSPPPAASPQAKGRAQQPLGLEPQGAETSPTPRVQSDPPRPEIPHEMVASLAYELWQLHGGNDVLNWLEAEHLLQQVLADRVGCSWNGGAQPANDGADARASEGRSSTSISDASIQ